MSPDAPLLVLDAVEAFLDEHGLGSGPVQAERIGARGGSNFSYLITRDEGRFVLRRPPRPPFPPSAHDVVREARLQLALAPQFPRVPTIRAICDDEGVIGVPFYVMDFLEGDVVIDDLPAGLDGEEARRSLGLALVDALAEIHRVDVAAPALAAFIRAGSYLERQLRRFGKVWEVNRFRPIPEVVEVGEWLARTAPEPLPLAVVHGDYRLGNVMVAPDDPTRIVAVLDWELAAIGDPRADLGYLVATWSEAGGENPLGTSPVTATPGFPTKDELVAHYVDATGLPADDLVWFEVLALWRAAVFCEGIYGRFVRGELPPGEERAARFETVVPAVARTALELTAAGG